MDFHLSKARAKIARAKMRARAILRLVEIGLKSMISKNSYGFNTLVANRIGGNPGGK